MLVDSAADSRRFRTVDFFEMKENTFVDELSFKWNLMDFCTAADWRTFTQSHFHGEIVIVDENGPPIPVSVSLCSKSGFLQSSVGKVEDSMFTGGPDDTSWKLILQSWNMRTAEAVDRWSTWLWIHGRDASTLFWGTFASGKPWPRQHPSCAITVTVCEWRSGFIPGHASFLLYVALWQANTHSKSFDIRLPSIVIPVNGMWSHSWGKQRGICHICAEN